MITSLTSGADKRIARIGFRCAREHDQCTLAGKTVGIGVARTKITHSCPVCQPRHHCLMHENGYNSSLAGKPGSGNHYVEVISGTVMHNEPRIVRIGRYWTEFVPEGYILFCRNPDQPGMIGRVGTILGKAKVNIRHMDVGPSERSPNTKELNVPLILL